MAGVSRSECHVGNVYIFGRQATQFYIDALRSFKQLVSSATTHLASADIEGILVSLYETLTRGVTVPPTLLLFTISDVLIFVASSCRIASPTGLPCISSLHNLTVSPETTHREFPQRNGFLSIGYPAAVTSLRRLPRNAQSPAIRVFSRPSDSLPTPPRGNPRLPRELRRHRLHLHPLCVSPRGSAQGGSFHAEIGQRRTFPATFPALSPIGSATGQSEREFPALRGVTRRLELSPSRCRHFARHPRDSRGVSPRRRRASPDASRHSPARGNRGEEFRL